MREVSTNKIIRRVKFAKEVREYELLHLLEFDSKRKKMSVIVIYLKTNEIFLLTKGAEDAIFSCATSGNIVQCDRDISKFARIGWRTLVFSFRILTKEELRQYNKLLLDAYNDINSRDIKINEAFSIIESGLTLVGSTGIEDRLQEKCGETLETLRKAGIKVWVLTGDKRETALNISKSCKHFSNDMILLNLCELDSIDKIEKSISEAKER